VAEIILVGMSPRGDGQIAAPRASVEPLWSIAVLSFEGEGSQQFRISAARCEKIRLSGPDGPMIGVSRLTGLGLREVSNQSDLFLSQNDDLCATAGGTGTGVLPAIAKAPAPTGRVGHGRWWPRTSLGTPGRALVGWDPSRLSRCWPCWRAPLRLVKHFGGRCDMKRRGSGCAFRNPAAGDICPLADGGWCSNSLANAHCRRMRFYFGEI